MQLLLSIKPVARGSPFKGSFMIIINIVLDSDTTTNHFYVSLTWKLLSLVILTHQIFQNSPDCSANMQTHVLQKPGMSCSPKCPAWHENEVMKLTK